jgi:hypothetical protein
LGESLNANGKCPRGPPILLEEPAQTTIGQAFIPEMPCVHRRLQLAQAIPEALEEPLVPGLFLGLAIGAAGQDKDLLAIGSADPLDVHSFLHRVPVLMIGQLALKPTQYGLGWAHDVRRATPVQSGDVLLADHSPIHHPDAVGPPVFLLHGRDHLIDGRGVVAIAGEDLVAQRKAVLGDDQADQHLEAIGTAVAGVATPCQRIGRTLALEIGAGDIVEEQLVLQVEEVSQPLPQVAFQLVLVRQEMIEPRVEPVGVDFLDGDTQEITQGRAAIPGVLDV